MGGIVYMSLLEELQNLDIDDSIDELHNETLPLVMWGAGSSASEVFYYLQNRGIKIADIFVDDEYYSENMVLEGKTVLSYSMLKEKYDMVNVIMGNSYYEKKEILKKKECIGDVFCLFSMSYHVFERTSYEEIEQHLQDFQETLDVLEDELSKSNFMAFLKTRVSGNNRYIEEVFKYETTFFENDIIQLCENEVYLDVGAFDGDTIRMFLRKTDHRYQHIYEFEADDENYLKLRNYISDIKLERIELSNKGAWNEKGRRAFLKNQKQASGVADNTETHNYIQADISTIMMESLDEMFYYTNKVTLFKINYRNGVKEALEGSANILRDHMPKLVITVGFDCYNVRAIPKLIKRINSKYRFYMRFCRSMASGLVLYGVAEEAE